MKDLYFVIAFPDSLNNAMYVDGSNKGTDSIDLAIKFTTPGAALGHIKEKNITSESWIEDQDGEVVH